MIHLLSPMPGNDRGRTCALQATPPSDSARNEERGQDNRAMRRGFSWLGFGNIVTAACAWGRVALLARFGNVEMIGQLTLAWAICCPIGSLADLGLSGSLISDAKGEYRLRHYLGLRIFTCALSFVVICIFARCDDANLATAWQLVLAGLVVASESVCELLQAVLQRGEQMNWVAISLTLRGLLGLGLFGLAIWLTGELAWGICGFILAAMTTLLTIDIPRALACERTRVCGQLDPTIRRTAMSRATSRKKLSVWIDLAWLSLPLGLATTSLSLMNSLPRYWIKSRLGSAALGEFAVAGSLMIANSLVVGALSQAASPRLARYHAAGNVDALFQLLWQLGLWLVGTMFFSILIMSVGGQWILGLLFGPAYSSLANTAVCLMLAAGMRNLSILLGRAISSTRRFRTSLLIRVAGIAVLVILLPDWIDWLGLMGAAWALTLSWLITVLLSMAAVAKELEQCRTRAALILTESNDLERSDGQDAFQVRGARMSRMAG
jgi:O-antigen/teichoic acid export membrane protein